MAAVVEYCIIYYTNLCRQFWIDSGVDCWHSLRSECNHRFCESDEVNDTPPPVVTAPLLSWVELNAGLGDLLVLECRER